MNKSFSFFVTLTALFVAVGVTHAQGLTPKEELGKRIFFDTNLSDPVGQACAACHGPNVGFTGPISDINNTSVVYPGAVPTRFGDRKPPSAAYGGTSPVMFLDKHNTFVGGMFWDGRATGWELGDPLAEQARGPFLNPMEQNIASKAIVIQKIQTSTYAPLFVQVYGNIWSNVNLAYNKTADAISAYEKSIEVNPFSSKYDYYLKGLVRLTKQEQKGLNLFRGKGKCEKCHPSKPGLKGGPPVFTDFTYDNLGIPKNNVFPFNTQPPDVGLGGFLSTVPTYAQYADANMGKHKVATLRNVDKRPNASFVKAYGHNGLFKSLKDIVHFYNTRDVEAWPPPEVPQNVNTAELGNLRLTSEDEDDIVAFLKALSDGYVVPNSNLSLGNPSGFAADVVQLKNSPNPFNPSTIIQYSLPADVYVTLKVYNALGQEMTTLVDGMQEAGLNTVTFEAGSLPSGMYFCRLQAGQFVEQTKVLLLK